MYISIWCGGMPFDQESVKEKSLGGSESAAYYMAEELGKQGHKVTVFTNSRNETSKDNVRYLWIGDVNEHSPLGEAFHFYSTNTPVDVLIIQRHPAAFRYKYAAKINLLWLHDLALHDRKALMGEQVGNFDGVMVVSEYHKKQVCNVYNFDPAFVHVIRNAVDIDLYTELKEFPSLTENKKVAVNPDKFNMIYSSRPERGLEYLVSEGGIMDQLRDTDKHLYVCGYENTTAQMADYYAFLNHCIEKLPNVTNVGSLSKAELAELQIDCDLVLYPTEFREVSCITAMEAMAAGTPMLTSEVAALPETCKKSGTVLIPLQNKKANVPAFVRRLKDFKKDKMHKLASRQVEKSETNQWEFSAIALLKVIYDIFDSVSNETKARELMRNGDIFALHRFLNDHVEDIDKSAILNMTADEMELYDFAFTGNFGEHYKNYYEYEKNRGVDYGPELLDNNSRYETVKQLISNIIMEEERDDLTILDYGCAHGHYSVNLAKTFSNCTFIGFDIAASNIEKARNWAGKDKVPNVSFANAWVNIEKKSIEIAHDKTGEVISEYDQAFDVVIAAEVIEHIDDYQTYINILNDHLEPNGKFIITVPYGPWEYSAAHEHFPWRAHVHQFERQDLHDMLGHAENFNVLCTPSGATQEGDPLGSYVVSFNKLLTNCNEIDYSRKLRQTKGRETISLCMIVTNAEETLLKCLRSAERVINELVIAFDSNCNQETRNVVDEFIRSNPTGIAFKTFEIESPLETGFDIARNSSIDAASGDWIMWLDADEFINNGSAANKCARNSMIQGFAVAQHHFTMEPAGLIKTDYPCRMFRNHRDIQFYGVVHEHPETEMNKGVEFMTRMPEMAINHNGYQNEAVRRGRFDRNIGLMARDRQKYPERNLGKFLWIRDLAQMIQFEIEMTHKPSKLIIDRAHEAKRTWYELIKSDHMRYIIESLDFMNTVNKVLGDGFDVLLRLDVDKPGIANLNRVKEVVAFFNTKKDAKLILDLIIKDRLQVFDHIDTDQG